MKWKREKPYRCIIVVATFGLLTGCGEVKDFAYWKKECTEKWKEGAFHQEGNGECSDKEVQEYVKRSGEKIEK